MTAAEIPEQDRVDAFEKAKAGQAELRRPHLYNRGVRLAKLALQTSDDDPRAGAIHAMLRQHERDDRQARELRRRYPAEVACVRESRLARLHSQADRLSDGPSQGRSREARSGTPRSQGSRRGSSSRSAGGGSSGSDDPDLADESDGDPPGPVGKVWRHNPPWAPGWKKPPDTGPTEWISAAELAEALEDQEFVVLPIAGEAAMGDAASVALQEIATAVDALESIGWPIRTRLLDDPEIPHADYAVAIWEGEPPAQLARLLGEAGS